MWQVSFFPLKVKTITETLPCAHAHDGRHGWTGGYLLTDIPLTPIETQSSKWTSASELPGLVKKSDSWRCVQIPLQIQQGICTLTMFPRWLLCTSRRQDDCCRRVPFAAYSVAPATSSFPPTVRRCSGRGQVGSKSWEWLQLSAIWVPHLEHKDFNLPQRCCGMKGNPSHTGGSQRLQY